MKHRPHRRPMDVLASYFLAKDGNRPHLLDRVFTADAQLEMHNASANIDFPALTQGREAIADVLVRRFGQTYENVYSFYLARPPAATRAFSCDWLVCMSEKEGKGVRVGCGRYDWAFQAEAPNLAQRLTISIHAMQVLPPGQLDAVLAWTGALNYPWTNVAALRKSAPRIEELAPVLDYLGRDNVVQGVRAATRYDPDRAPDAAAWLALDEQLRIQLIEDAHRAARIDLPRPAVHAALHGIVENQLAIDMDAVKRALVRLMHEGLSRHEAVHAIATVSTEMLWESAQPESKIPAEHAEAHYIAAFERLSAAQWRRDYGD